MPDKAGVRRALEERIQLREEQVARFGIEAPAHIISDLDEARRGLAALDALEPPQVSRDVQEVINAVPQSERDKATFLAILSLNADMAGLKRKYEEDEIRRENRQRETDEYRIRWEARMGNVRMALAVNAVATVLGWIFRRR
jgi:hypothetical protein